MCQCAAVGFTNAVMSAPNHPVGAMLTIARLFRNFDVLHAAVPNAHKIETAGDAYMSVIGARGAPGLSPNDIDAAHQDPWSQARAAAGLALSMVDASRKHAWPSGVPADVRVGVHCGPAIAGAIGGKIPRWGLFGPTPIIASRMESHGAKGRVHVSEQFATALRGPDGVGDPRFTLTEVSPIVDVKGIGPLKTFWLDWADSAALRHANQDHTVLALHNRIRSSSPLRVTTVISPGSSPSGSFKRRVSTGDGTMGASKSK
jgi:class 3 adenylate cyclase